MEDIQELKNQLAELQEKIEKLENKKENKRWRAERGEPYYCISGEGKLTDSRERYDAFDDNRYKTRNYFKTEEEAEEYQEKVNIYYDLMDFAEELSKDDPVDWNNENQEKYFIQYNTDADTIEQEYEYTVKNIGQIYCTDFNYREKAMDKFGKEKLKKLCM